MRLLFLALFFSTFIFAQQSISGYIKDEDGNAIVAAGIYNISNGKKAASQLDGTFQLEAKENDELRIIRVGYERTEHIVKSSDFFAALPFVLIRSVYEIEEVEVPSVRLTGDLEKDSKLLAKTNKVAQLQKQIGLPEAPEKPRETPAEVGKNILLPILGGRLNVQAVYDVVSGKAKRQKRLYAYEDLKDEIDWMKSRVEPAYFVELGIPVEKIDEFLRYCVALKPEVRKYAKAKNVTKILLIVEEVSPIYIKKKEID